MSIILSVLVGRGLTTVSRKEADLAVREAMAGHRTKLAEHIKRISFLYEGRRTGELADYLEQVSEKSYPPQ